MKRVTVVVASSGKNLELAHEIMTVLKNKNVNTHLLNIVEMNLPLYTSNAESAHSAEELIKPHQQHLDAEGLIFVAPEYNGGPPPALTNFIAWVSRSTKNWREVFSGKTAMIASHSGGAGFQALAIMRLQLSFVGMNVVGRQLSSSLGKPYQQKDIENALDSLLKTL